MKTRFCIVMGVSGNGRTSVGSALARELGWDFHDMRSQFESLEEPGAALTVNISVSGDEIVRTILNPLEQ